MSDNWFGLYKKIKGLNIKTVILPAVIFIVLLLSTYFVWTKITEQISYDKQNLFNQEAQRAIKSFQDRIVLGNSVLSGMKGYYESMQRSITPQEWLNYIKQLEPQAKNSCIDAIGYIKKVSQNNLSEEIKNANDYVALFNGNFGPVVFHPQGNKENYYIIKYFFPLDEKSFDLLGFDYSSQEQLNQTIQSSGSLSTIQITPIQKMWDNNHPRVDALIPIYYKQNYAFESSSTLRGFGLAITDIDNCARSIIGGSVVNGINYKAVDITGGSQNDFFQSDNWGEYPHQFFEQQKINFYNRQWLIEFESAPDFGNTASNTALVFLIPIFGILLSFFVSSLVLMYSTSRARAYGLVDKVTGLLQESEAKLKELFYKSPDPIFILDNSGRFVDMNVAGEKMHGIPKEELIRNHKIFDFISPSSSGIDESLWEKFIKQGNIRFDFVFKHPQSGEERHMEVSAAANYIPGMNIAIIRDVTKNRELENALKKAEQLWKTIFSAANDAILILDDNQEIISCNLAAERIYKESKEKIIGKRIIDIRYDKDQNKINEQFGNVIKNNGLIFETKQVRGNGDIFDAEVSVKPFKIFDKDYIVDIVRDISERKKIEAKEKKISKDLKILSESNQAMIKSQNEQEFLDKLCRIIVETGEYKFVWIGEAFDDGEKSVKPVAQCGFNDDYLKNIKVSWGENEYGMGPTGSAIRNKTVSVVRNIENDPNYSVWRSEAEKRGYLSSVALPIIVGIKIFGALNIYSSEADAFNQEEVELLDKLSGDIGFGINSIRLKNEIKSSEEKYRKMIELSPDAVVIHSGEKIVFVNNAAIKIFGAKSSEEIVGKPTMSFVHPDSINVVKERISEMINKKEPVPVVDEKFLKIDGSPIDVSVVAAPIIYDGRPAIQVIVHDITERKRSEVKMKELNSELEKFKLAVENASDHIIITDIDGNIIFANKAASQTTGYPINEMIGKTPRLWGGQMPLDFYKGMWNTIKYEKRPFFGEIKNKRKSGEFYQAVASVSPVLNEKGDVMFFVGIERDVTKERAIDKSKSEFVSLASHQLRTPLSAINWYTEMLMDEDVGKLNTKQRDYLKEIYNSSKRMTDLVGSLLNVSRIDLGTFAIEPKPTDIVEIVKSVIKELSHQIKKKKQKIKEEYDTKIGLLNVDPNLMRIVFQNLISNSVKYTPPSGEVDVKIKKEGDDIIVSVSDTGYGIPKSQQSRIFEKFFRADNVREIETDGNGLGLYMVKEIVEKSGGSIRFESEENKGTKFFVSIPISGMVKKEGEKKLS